MDKYLKETLMLDYNTLIIQNLLKTKGWLSLFDFSRGRKISNYVRDGINQNFGIFDSPDELLKTMDKRCQN